MDNPFVHMELGTKDPEKSKDNLSQSLRDHRENKISIQI
jgi:hypothetical protein